MSIFKKIEVNSKVLFSTAILLFLLLVGISANLFAQCDIATEVSIRNTENQEINGSITLTIIQNDPELGFQLIDVQSKMNVTEHIQLRVTESGRKVTFENLWPTSYVIYILKEGCDYKEIKIKGLATIVGDQNPLKVN